MNCITPKFLNLDPIYFSREPLTCASPTPWDLTGMAPIWVQLSSWHNSVMMPPARLISEFLWCFLVFFVGKTEPRTRIILIEARRLLAQSVPSHESFASNIWLERLGKEREGTVPVLVVSFIFYFHPYLGKIPVLTFIFFRWVETTNQYRFL